MRRQDQGERAGSQAGVGVGGWVIWLISEQGECTCLVRGVSASDGPLTAASFVFSPPAAGVSEGPVQPGAMEGGPLPSSSALRLPRGPGPLPGLPVLEHPGLPGARPPGLPNGGRAD